MTARAPILRLNIKSERSRVLTENSDVFDKKRGEEYCVFPGKRNAGYCNLKE